MGRNPPKNLSKSTSSRATQLKKEHPKLTIKEAKALASAELSGRLGSRISELEEAELMAPEIPEQLEIKDNLEQFVESTGTLPTPEEANAIIEAVVEKRKGRYATKAKYAMADEFRKKQLEKRILAGLRTSVADTKRLQQIVEEGQRRGRSLSDVGLSSRSSPTIFSSTAPISFASPSPTESGAVFDSSTGQVFAELRHPQTGELVDPNSSYGKFLIRRLGNV